MATQSDDITSVTGGMRDMLNQVKDPRSSLLWGVYLSQYLHPDGTYS